ncbi:hypothetical protein [Ruixingdingia sedimenti]|uniref:Uncharacterized protein n=1 Tax=Ruixingdingia sedimenti TaxID=3073604 RepID=A0ABU1F7T6_9RHOB|nr:hypothetical protein [Xinfangfangia sp. LG-4]MDR5652926.1 hypothetical protein [Xinfangfangia sp. LG-4]
MRCILIAIISLMPMAGRAAAADLWCMPDRLCRGDRCAPTRDEETSLRLRDFEGARPVLRSHAEDVPMRPTQQGATASWQGTDAAGAVLALSWRRSDGGFAFLRRFEGRDWTASGRCEVQ